MAVLTPDLREALARVGTSTLTGVLNRRGLKSMTLYDVWPMRPEQPRMVGIAFTMRFIPSREDKDGPASTSRSMVQPQAMEECPPGHVLMIEEVSEALYRVDRMMFHLTGQASIRRVAGIRLGRVSEIVQNDPDFGLTAEEIQDERIGLIVGEGGPSTQVILQAAATTVEKGAPKRIGPFAVPKAMASGPSAVLSTWFQMRGINYSISSACATSAHCIGAGVEQIQWGKQDVVFAGGCEDIDWSMSNMFDAMGAMSSDFNDNPSVASRAYDANRDGFVIAGGAGIVVLEEYERAKARGRSTTRLLADERMRGDMIAGLRAWRDAAPTRGKVISSVEHDGWKVEQVVSPLGIVAFVFEGRPNVFADAAGVLRTGNTAVLRIGSDALGTAQAIVTHALNPALADAGLPAGAVSLVESVNHAAGWAMFADRRLSLAVARGSGRAVSQLGSIAQQAGTAVSLHGTGGAWMIAGEHANDQWLSTVVVNSLDRKVCNTLNVCCIVRSRASELCHCLLTQ